MKRNRTLWQATIGLVIAMPTLAVRGDEPLFKTTRQSIDGGDDSEEFGKAREKMARLSSFK